MNYAEFQKQARLSRQDICRKVFTDNRKPIWVKKENTVVKNLERIFSATLKISNNKGFQAMSMRDASYGQKGHSAYRRIRKSEKGKTHGAW